MKTKAAKKKAKVPKTLDEVEVLDSYIASYLADDAALKALAKKVNEEEKVIRALLVENDHEPIVTKHYVAFEEVQPVKEYLVKEHLRILLRVGPRKVHE